MDFVRHILAWLKDHPLASGLALAGTSMVCYMITKKKKITHRRQVGQLVGWVSKVNLFPVKSIKPMAGVNSVLCDKMGLTTNDGRKIRDRSWLFSLESGTIMTMRAEPKLALIQPSFTPDGDFLLLDAPGMSTLRISTGLTQHESPTLDVNVWGLHSEAVHCGEEAASWICKYLGKKGFIIAYHPPTMKGVKINEGPQTYHKAFRDDDTKAFADSAPVLLMTQSSVDDVIARVGNSNITEMNFRPSIHLEGTTRAYDEDTWDKVYIGDQVVLENRILAQRCLGTNVDPKKGIKLDNQEPLKTISGYRTKIGNDPCLGLFMSVEQAGEVKFGDSVYVTRKK